MSNHRVELYVSFTVCDGRDGGRWVANEVLRQLNMFGANLWGLGLADDLEATPGTVDGIDWYEKWPSEPDPAQATADQRTAWRCGRCGKLNEDEAVVLWDDDYERWFQVGDKYGNNQPRCHGCLANIYTHPELMGQMYRLQPIEAP